MALKEATPSLNRQVVALRPWTRGTPGMPRSGPSNAAEELPVLAAGLTGRVLNSYRFGGYLGFAGIPPFVDGRTYLLGGDQLPSLLDEYAIEWAIFEPLDPAVALISHLPGSERIYTDKDAVVLRRSRTAAEAGSAASAQASAETAATTAAAGHAQLKRW